MTGAHALLIWQDIASRLFSSPSLLWLSRLGGLSDELFRTVGGQRSLEPLQLQQVLQESSLLACLFQFQNDLQRLFVCENCFPTGNRRLICSGETFSTVMNWAVRAFASFIPAV